MIYTFVINIVLNFKKDAFTVSKIPKNLINTLPITVLAYDMNFLTRLSLEGGVPYKCFARDAAFIRGRHQSAVFIKAGFHCSAFGRESTALNSQACTARK